MNQRLRNKIEKALHLNDGEWLEPADIIRGFKIKVDNIDSRMLKVCDELGFKLRYATTYSFSKNSLIAFFEPKEIKE